MKNMMQICSGEMYFIKKLFKLLSRCTSFRQGCQRLGKVVKSPLHGLGILLKC